MQKQLKNQRSGFTLIEMLIFVVLLGITAAAILSLNGGLFTNASKMREIQINVQLLQACAEQVRTSRYFSGFTQTANYYDSLCEVLPLVTPNSNKFEVSNVATVASSCPVGATCQLVEVRVNGTSGTIGPISLQLMNY